VKPIAMMYSPALASRLVRAMHPLATRRVLVCPTSRTTRSSRRRTRELLQLYEPGATLRDIPGCRSQ
jgi:hypothetical protein